MKIALFTNTYLPHVGGVARSVQTLAEACRARGHQVRVVAPEFENATPQPDVLRVPAIQHFHGSDFSVRLPVPNLIRDFMDDFRPDIIHSHHPFLLGDAALRESWKMRVPLVFTHHTLYERYTHYIPLDSPALQRFALRLACEYCELCNQVIAPSESIARLLRERGVSSPITAIPTGIDTAFFAAGKGTRFRKRAGIPHDAQVIGHTGRLAREKNLLFLADALAPLLAADRNRIFLVVGDGDARAEMLDHLRPHATADQLCFVGSQSGSDLADAYAAMDCFAFASQTETQGLVLAEAMAAGKPVVALDGPGVREILHDQQNGLLLDAHASTHDFGKALARLLHDPALSASYSRAARNSAASYDRDHCIDRVLDCYAALIERHPHDPGAADPGTWDRLLAGISVEWSLLVEKMSAAAAAVSPSPATEAHRD